MNRGGRVSSRMKLPRIPGFRRLGTEQPKAEGSGRMRLAGAGLELGAAVAGCTLIGWYIDRRFGTAYGAVTGAILGIIGGLYNFIRQSLEIVRDDERRRKQHDDAEHRD
jgi:F0F1-type ATP synthase assembly protein I